MHSVAYEAIDHFLPSWIGKKPLQMPGNNGTYILHFLQLFIRSSEKWRQSTKILGQLPSRRFPYFPNTQSIDEARERCIFAVLNRCLQIFSRLSAHSL